MAMTEFPRGQGGYAEHAVIDESLAAYLPDDADLVAAASIPLAAGTAWEVLSKLDHPGSTMLVVGASGGVGLFLLQLASAQGIKVIGVGRERNHDLMRSYGATACVDYRSPDAIATAVELAGGAFDSIADLVGGPLTAMAQPHLRADGTIAAIAAPELAIDSLIDANQSLHGILIRDNGERVRQLAELFTGGRLRTHVARVLPLDDVDRGAPAGGLRRSRRKGRSHSVGAPWHPPGAARSCRRTARVASLHPAPQQAPAITFIGRSTWRKNAW